MKSQQKRPKFLNLFVISLPVTGVSSFAHRVSGALLFLSVPGLIYLFGLSVRNAEGYARVLALFDTFCLKVVLSLLVWAVAHHLLAGIRFLLTDVGFGIDLKMARATAWTGNIAGLLIFLYFLYRIWS